MIKLFVASAMAASFALAPIQCKSDRDPNLRKEDTAGDALYALAQKFRAEHDDAAARTTLQYLVDRYPSSRHTETAKSEIEEIAQRSGGSAPKPAGQVERDGGS